MAAFEVKTAPDGTAYVEVAGEVHTLRLFAETGETQAGFDRRKNALGVAADTPAVADAVMAGDVELQALLDAS